MQCDRVLKLVDPYVDGELSAPMAAEVAAHCVRCTDCGRTLALAQVTASVIASGRAEPALSDDFTERLLACVQAGRALSAHRGRRWLIYGAAAVAAAAVLMIAFISPMRERPKIVAGMKEAWPLGTDALTHPGGAGDGPAADWKRLAEPFERGYERTHDFGVTLQRSFDAAMLEVIRALEAQAPRQAEEGASQPADGKPATPRTAATEDL